MWFALSTFCGLRPEETDHIQKSQIHASEGWIRVEISKVKQRRVVYPTKEAMRLVKACMKLKGWPLTINQRRRAIRALRNRLGWKEWPKDITRHSAASYWLATSQSAASVAESLGHSESVLKRHYKALVTKKQALQFWAVAEKMAKRIGAG